MKLKIEMENTKVYTLNWQETVADFEQKVTFVTGNDFLLTDTGKHISIKKIVEWEVLE